MDQARARVVVLVTAALCCTGMVVGMIAMPADALFIGGFLAFPVIGALILAKVPGHDIGRLMVGVGVGWAVAGIGVALSHATGPHADAWLGLMESMGIVVAYLCLLLIFVLFPSPVVQAAGKRLLVGAIGIVAVTGVVCTVISPVAEEGFPVSPLAVQGLAAPIRAIQTAVGFAYLVLLAVTLLSLASRMRRSSGIERLQFRWFLSGVCVLVIAFLMSSIVPIPGPVILVALSAPPVAIGVAIVRFRLYEIDRLISRSLSYAVVTGVVLGVYAGVVATVSRLLPESGALAVAGATLAAAALFRPALRRVQAVVDRRFYRAKYDAALEVDAFAARLRDLVDPQSAVADLVAVVSRTVQPASVGVWVGSQR